MKPKEIEAILRDNLKVSNGKITGITKAAEAINEVHKFEMGELYKEGVKSDRPRHNKLGSGPYNQMK